MQVLGDWSGWVMWQGCLTIGSPSLCSLVGCIPAPEKVEGCGAQGPEGH